MNRSTAFLASVLVVVISSGCAPNAVVEDAPADELKWQPCSWSAAGTDLLAECASVAVPLDHEHEGGDLIELGLKRRTAQKPATAQLWVLAGGPGDAATEEMELLAHGAHELREDLDLYAVDHRGTGGSERLVCSSSELYQCGQELAGTVGDRLAHISALESARDLAWLFARLTPADTQLFLYGGSYGTYLAQRYLELDAERVSGVILEGVVHPSAPFAGYDRRMNDAGRAIFERCAGSSACASHFSEPPWTVAEKAIQGVEAGACSVLGMTSNDARSLLASVALHTELLPLMPAIAQRLARCSEHDVAEIRHFLDALSELSQQTAASPELGAHVSISELLGQQPDPAQLVDELSSYAVATGAEASLAAVADGWPAYTAQPVQLSQYSGPMLMLQGGLDPASPVERAHLLARHYDGPQQTLALFPDASHSIIGNTPSVVGDCALSLFAAFLRAPDVPLSVDCIETVPAVDFDGNADLAELLLGSSTWHD